MTLFIILLSLLSGTTRVFSRLINGELTKVTGPLQSTFYNYMTGLAASLFIVLIMDKGSQLFLTTTLNLPYWAYFGGLVGVVFILLSNLIVGKISNFSMSLFLLIGQIGGGLLIDQLTGKVITPTKIAGAVLIVLAIVGPSFSYKFRIVAKTLGHKPLPKQV